MHVREVLSVLLCNAYIIKNGQPAHSGYINLLNETSGENKKCFAFKSIQFGLFSRKSIFGVYFRKGLQMVFSRSQLERVSRQALRKRSVNEDERLALELRNFFANDVVRLEAILGRELSLWH